MSDKPIIIVFQMAKVASLSWYEAIRAADPNAPVFHLHFVSEEARDFIRGLGSEAGPTQTIKRPSLLLPAGSIPAALADRITRGRWVGGPVRLLTGVRDPVARAISALMHAADILGHRTIALAFREGAEIGSLLSVFRLAWANALGTARSPDSFARMMSFGFSQYRSWFDREMKGGFGIDATHASRAAGRRTWQIAGGQVELLIYRQEDLARAELTEEVSEFLKLTLDRLPLANKIGGRRRSSGLYKELQARAKLPEELLDRIYSEPTVSHFYSADEVRGFKARWSPELGMSLR